MQLLHFTIWAGDAHGLSRLLLGGEESQVSRDLSRLGTVFLGPRSSNCLVSEKLSQSLSKDLRGDCYPTWQEGIPGRDHGKPGSLALGAGP